MKDFLLVILFILMIPIYILIFVFYCIPYVIIDEIRERKGENNEIS